MNESGIVFILFPPSSSSSVVTFTQGNTTNSAEIFCLCVCECVLLTGKYLCGWREGLSRQRGIITVTERRGRQSDPAQCSFSSDHQDHKDKKDQDHIYRTDPDQRADCQGINEVKDSF